MDSGIYDPVCFPSAWSALSRPLGDTTRKRKRWIPALVLSRSDEVLPKRPCEEQWKLASWRVERGGREEKREGG